MTKHIILATLFTTTSWSAPEPADQALIIAPFTLKSSDGTLALRMDESGKIFLGEKHIVTAHAEGTLTSSEGELLLKLNQKGMIEDPQGETGECPIEITEDGTLKFPGAITLKWEDGRLEFGDGNHLTLEPKDSPATRIASLCAATLVIVVENQPGDVALTFDGDKPVLSADFVKNLSLEPGELVRVNHILRRMRAEYLAVEKKQLDKITVTEDQDGTKHFMVPPFGIERGSLEQKLWAELGKVLDERQLRLAQQSNGLSSVNSNLFDWGNATYTITIWDTGEGFEIDCKMDGGLGGPNGSSSMSRMELPDKYLRLLAN